MKKCISLLLCFSLIIGVAASLQIVSFAADSGTLVFAAYDENSYCVAGNNSISGNVVIPAEYEGKPVVRIEEGSFAGCTGITAVTIPDSVKSVGANSFYNCTNLLTVNFGAGVETIEDAAFMNCTKLTAVILPAAVTEINDYAFMNCVKVKNVQFNDSLEVIGANAFQQCNSISRVTLSKSLYRFDGDAFANCKQLSSINVPIDNENYASLNGVVFTKDMETLVSYPTAKSGAYIIPDTVTDITENAFSFCNNLSSVTIPASVTNIQNLAFIGCRSALETIIVSDDNPEYSSLDGVLYNKNKTSLIMCPTGFLGAFTIPESVTEIGSYGFAFCTLLTSLEISKSVTDINSSAFFCCTSLSDLTVSPENEQYVVDDSVLFSKDMTSLFFCPTSKSGKYVVPSGVKSIREVAFFNCENLTDVILPSSLNSISYEAFAGCRGLTSITVPDKVTSIDYAAFGFFIDVFNNAVITVPNIECFVMKGSDGSVAQSYAEENGIPFEAISLFSTEKTTVDYDALTLFSSMTFCTDINNIVAAKNGAVITPFASLTNGEKAYYGTGSTVAVDGVTYTIIVNGDLDGDSIADVTDIMLTEQLLSGNVAPEPNAVLAANGYVSDTVDINSYQNVVNTVLA